MNDKRYYWLKLEENYFDLKVQKALRKLPSGAEMLICYLKMQLRYLNKGGMIEFNGMCQNIEEEIAIDIDEDIDLVKMTVGVLSKWNVIEQCNKDLYIAEMQQRIGSKTDSALRVEKHRKKQEMLHCNNDVTKCNSIKDIDIELDKDIDISSNSIYDFVQENFGRTLNSIEYEKIDKWQEQFSDEMLKYAVELAVMSNVKTFRYLEGILNNWTSSGYKTIDEVKVKEKPKQKDAPIIPDYNWLEDNEEGKE